MKDLLNGFHATWDQVVGTGLVNWQHGSRNKDTTKGLGRERLVAESSISAFVVESSVARPLARPGSLPT
jgi:hypothetical protein